MNPSVLFSMNMQAYMPLVQCIISILFTFHKKGNANKFGPNIFSVTYFFSHIIYCKDPSRIVYMDFISL